MTGHSGGSRRSFASGVGVGERSSDDDDEYDSLLASFDREADAAVSALRKRFGDADLSKSDCVTLMDGWNKALAFETAWKEACWLRWRMLEAMDAVRKGKEGAGASPRPGSVSGGQGGGRGRGGDREGGAEKGAAGGDPRDAAGLVPEGGQDRAPSSPRPLDAAGVRREARRLLEANADPLAAALGPRACDGKNLMLALFDGSIRALCPHSQTVQREAYRPVDGSSGGGGGGAEAHGFGDLEAKSPTDVLRLLSRCGVRPSQALTLADAFLFAMRTHVPYALEDEAEDLALPDDAGAFSRFVSSRVSRPLVEDMRDLRRHFAGSDLYRRHAPTFWDDVKSRMRGTFGQTFYENLLTDHPELLDYFNRTDMDGQSEHIVRAVDLIVQYPKHVGEAGGSYRKFTDHLADVHSRLGIPTSAYPKVGRNLIRTLEPFAEGYCQCVNWSEGRWGSEPNAKAKAEEVQAEAEAKEEAAATKDGCGGNRRAPLPLTTSALLDGFLQLYAAAMSFTFYPTLRTERTAAKAAEFYAQLADELSWSPAELSRRLLEVNLEISSTGTYNQTSEEVRTGMRLAWRNSVKCIGRISWNTLEVRDKRHVTDAKEICQELERHLELATAGTNIQSVMTVFRPRRPDEAFGMRLWTEQLVRYACYKDDETGEILGDPANLEFTSFLLRKGLWTPPSPRTRQDVLPLVFSIPGEDNPYVHTFPPKYIDEAPMVHPDCPEVATLGYRWAAVPIINTFNIDIGGVEYGTFPFNGWFCSTEIVRDLQERFPWNEELTEAMGLDPGTRMLELRLQHETERAVLHSFDEAGYTVVDPRTAAEQYAVHCRREKDAGRECPAQWSWIGGLVGPTNPVWHREMRDFRKTPQYEYTAHQWLVAGYADTTEEEDEEEEGEGLGRSASACALADAVEGDGERPALALPRCLVAYGSETGTAEAAAVRLARALRLIRPMVAPLNGLAGMERDEWEPYTHVLVLCSTFGKGLPPANAEAFFDQDDLPEACLGHAKVSVLALGSSVYPDFCKAGIDVEGILRRAGGEIFVPIAKADAACDSAGTVTEWVNLVTRLVLPPQLKAEIESRLAHANEPPRHLMKWSKDDNGSGSATEGAPSSTSAEIDRYVWPEEKSVPCRINEELLDGGDVDKRSTRRIAFPVPFGQSYVSGDHLSVKPLNSIDDVERFARCFIEELGGEGGLWSSLRRPFRVECVDNGQVYSARLPFATPATLADVLQAEVSLSLSDVWVAAIVELLYESVPSSGPEAEAHAFVRNFNYLGRKILAGGRAKAAEHATNAFLGRYPTVMDLLEDLACYRRESGSGAESEGPAAPPLAEVLAIMPRLQPRLYSISSSNRTDPTRAEITVGVLHLKTREGINVKGVCSNYLARLVPGKDRANVSIRESGFRGPSDVNHPMIMVGAGTGLAPMMGFMADRARELKEIKKEGASIRRSCHLFFGARNEGEQIYKGTVAEYENAHVLQLHLALSRSEVVPKTYVQDEIASFAERLCDLLLDENCSYYVCGDANMADRCYEACLEALKTRMSRVKAVRHLRLMRVKGRWQSDLWGVSEALEEDYNEAKKILSQRKRNSAVNWLSKVKRHNEEEDAYL